MLKLQISLLISLLEGQCEINMESTQVLVSASVSLVSCYAITTWDCMYVIWDCIVCNVKIHYIVFYQQL